MILKYDFSPHAFAKSFAPLKESLAGLEQQFKNFDAIVLTSKDPFISEYVPLENNPRFGATRFTGSVGDAIYFTETFRAKNPDLKSVALFVDGRYHLQADNESNPELVEVVKLDVEPNIESGVQKYLSKFKGIKIGIDFERTSVAALARYQETSAEAGNSLTHISGDAVLKALKLPGWVVNRPIFSLKEEATGRSIATTLKGLSSDMQAKAGHSEVLHVTATTDDAAFLLNARGYHLPHHSSILAYTFFLKNELIVFLPASSKDCPVKLDESQLGAYNVTFLQDSLPALKNILKRHKVKQVFFNGSAMNALLPSLIHEIYPDAAVDSHYTWVLKTRARKTPEEMNSIRSSFLKSSKAIAKTLKHGKSESQRRDFSEVELAEFLHLAFKEEGATGLSFKTISGAGPHSAIVHYSTPSETSYFEKGMLALLDCGAYYQEGFATDTTRGFFVGGGNSNRLPEPWQKEIYTTTLKSAIQVFIKPVDASLSGKEVDAMIRGQVQAAGYDYLHGTGHGIGIHVHEDGIRLSTLSTYPQSPYAFVSVEPGIYLKDKGGVRVENAAFLIPEGETHYQYENVVFVGYDWDLIDIEKLTPEEKTYLKEYEAKCKKLGTELTVCPL